MEVEQLAMAPTIIGTPAIQGAVHTTILITPTAIIAITTTEIHPIPEIQGVITLTVQAVMDHLVAAASGVATGAAVVAAEVVAAVDNYINIEST